MSKAIIPYLLVIIGLLCSCSEESCDQETEVYLNVSFYETGTGSSLTLASLSVYGLGRADSLIYSNSSNNKIKLPLNPFSESSSFVINIKGTKDTLKIFHENELKFLSKSCGYIYLFEATDIVFTNDTIDNVKIEISNVFPGDEENIRIFF